jgi:hypothetical protein
VLNTCNTQLSQDQVFILEKEAADAYLCGADKISRSLMNTLWRETLSVRCMFIASLLKHSEQVLSNTCYRRQIQEALNQQTYHQFKSYAEQQYPGNPEQVYSSE